MCGGLEGLEALLQPEAPCAAMPPHSPTDLETIDLWPLCPQGLWLALRRTEPAHWAAATHHPGHATMTLIL